MTTTTIDTQLRAITDHLSSQAKPGDAIGRKNPFLQFNEMLIADLETRISKDSTLTLLYIHDLCKKGFYNSLKGVFSKAAHCFLQIEQLIDSLRKPDGDLVSMMAYPLIANFLVSKGELDLAASLVNRAIGLQHQLEPDHRQPRSYLYRGNMQILYSRILIRQGHASAAIDNLFTFFRMQMDTLTAGEKGMVERESASAAAIDILVELNKFALLNGHFNRLYQEFLAGVSGEEDGSGIKDGVQHYLLRKYLHIIRLAAGTQLEPLLSEFREFLLLEVDENVVIFSSYLLLLIKQAVLKAGGDPGECVGGFSAYIRKFGLEKKMETRIVRLLNDRSAMN